MKVKNLKYKVKNVNLFAIFTFTFLLLTSPVSAHVLKTDGTIGAVLHMEPEDDPIVGEQASFFFEFKDTQNKFDPQKCDCQFSILESGSQIYSQPLFQGNSQPILSNTAVFYTFPKRDVYQVKVVGDPTVASDFQPFDLTFDVRVSRENIKSTASSQIQESSLTNLFQRYLIFVIGGAILAIFIASVIIRSRFAKK